MNILVSFIITSITSMALGQTDITSSDEFCNLIKNRIQEIVITEAHEPDTPRNALILASSYLITCMPDRHSLTPETKFEVARMLTDLELMLRAIKHHAASSAYGSGIWHAIAASLLISFIGALSESNIVINEFEFPLIDGNFQLMLIIALVALLYRSTVTLINRDTMEQDIMHSIIQFKKVILEAPTAIDTQSKSEDMQSIHKELYTMLIESSSLLEIIKLLTSYAEAHPELSDAQLHYLISLIQYVQKISLIPITNYTNALGWILASAGLILVNTWTKIGVDLANAGIQNRLLLTIHANANLLYGISFFGTITCLGNFVRNFAGAPDYTNAPLIAQYNTLINRLTHQHRKQSDENS